MNKSYNITVDLNVRRLPNVIDEAEAYIDYLEVAQWLAEASGKYIRSFQVKSTGDASAPYVGSVHLLDSDCRTYDGEYVLQPGGMLCVYPDGSINALPLGNHLHTYLSQLLPSAEDILNSL